MLADDIRSNDEPLKALITELGPHPTARLTAPRLIDILVWSLHGPDKDAARHAAAANTRAA